jgi:DNA-binding ferritin-like protein
MVSETTESDSLRPDEVADHLDRLYCYHMMMAQWTIAVGSRHSSSHQPLLADLYQEALAHLNAATELASRIVQLGGTVTADPSDIAYRAPIDSFELPDNPSDAHRTVAQLHRLTTAAITAYRNLLGTLGESDPASSRIVVGLLATAVNRQRDLESAIRDE